MLVMRIILLLVVLGGLTLLLAQNWSPVLPLVFWVKVKRYHWQYDFAQCRCGACTSVFITGLFKLSNYFCSLSASISPQQRGGSRTQSSGSKKSTKQPPPVTSARHQLSPKDTTDDDWGSNSTDDDDWDFEDADKTEL